MNAGSNLFDTLHPTAEIPTGYLAQIYFGDRLSTGTPKQFFGQCIDFTCQVLKVRLESLLPAHIRNGVDVIVLNVTGPQKATEKS